jgi:hypothetical protein
MKSTNMSSASQSNDSQHEDKEREERLASLSEAMALARLSHQVKELEGQKHQQDSLAKPVFNPIKAIMYSLSRNVLILVTLVS